MRAVLLVGGFLAVAAAVASADDKDKGTKVELGKLSATAPPEWNNVEIKKPFLRIYQFSLPKAKGDPKDGEVVVFKKAGGTWEQNVARWKGQFKAPKGKSLDDVTKE